MIKPRVDSNNGKWFLNKYYKSKQVKKTFNSSDSDLEEKAAKKEAHPEDEEYGGYARPSQIYGERRSP